MPKKTVLLNATLSSISIYFMSVLLLPQWVIDETDTIKKNYGMVQIHQSEKYIMLIGQYYVDQSQRID
jgi:hypothetical protein